MPARKEVLTTVKLGKLEAGEASPAKVGQALGAHGINIMEFCRAYNAATETRRGEVVPADVTIYEDRSFSFVTRTPPTARLLLQAAGIDRGSAEPHADKVAAITREQLRAVALRKLPDLNTRDLDQAERIVAGTARSMGITIKD